MGDENPICTLDDYSKPSHKGYRNTIELPVGNNVIFYDHVSFHLKCEIERAASGKICNKNPEESWEIIENLALYDHKGWKAQKNLSNRSRALEKVLIREEAKSPVTKNVNSISLARGEVERNEDNDVATGDDIERTTRTKMGKPVKEVEKENEAENGIKNKPIRRAEKEETTEAPSSQLVEDYMKHRINEKLIEGLIDKHRFNDSLSRARAKNIKRRTYNLLPRGPVYEAIFRKKITRKEDIRGNFKIPYINEDEKMPFILGTPFLTTAKVVIKFDKGTITLRSKIWKE
nr:hypothetical protein [Tanacetum cinerariifolium]